MKQSEAPVGTLARLGHWDNGIRVMKDYDGRWRTLTGRIVEEESFRSGWDIEHRDWVFVDEELPPEGRVVVTRSESGMVQHLKRVSNLWFLADGSMYVYYNVVAWKDKVDA